MRREQNRFARLRRWAPALVVGVLAAWLGAYAAGLGARTVYLATATIQFDTSLLPTTLVRDDLTATSAVQLPIYAGLVRTSTVLADALARVGVPGDPQRFAGNVLALPVPDTSLLQVQVYDSDPGQAARLANAVADALIARAEAYRQATNSAVLQDLAAQIATQDGAVADLTARLHALPAGAPEQTDLATRLADANQLATTLRSSYAYYQTVGALNLQHPFMRVVDPAVPPPEPIAAASWLTGLLITAVALVVALAALWALDTLDTRVRPADDVPALLGLPLLGSIPRD